MQCRQNGVSSYGVLTTMTLLADGVLTYLMTCTGSLFARRGITDIMHVSWSLMVMAAEADTEI